MTTNDLAAIRARTDKATPGPWEIEAYRDIHPQDVWRIVGAPDPEYNDPMEVLDCTSVDYEGGGNPPSDADAAFIAAARTDVSNLCDEVEALRGELAAAREIIERLTAVHLSSDIAHRRELEKARAYLHNATEDADDRTT